MFMIYTKLTVRSKKNVKKVTPDFFMSIICGILDLYLKAKRYTQ